MKSVRNIEAVIFDWAGTTVDHGCMSPLAPFLEVFRRRGVTLNREVARGPMGVHKRNHIERLLAVPEVAKAFEAAQGRLSSEADLDAMFAELVPLQLAILKNFAEPVPGCLDVMAYLREHGIRVGSTTGYTRAMMDVLGPEAAKRAFAPSFTVSADEVENARTFPHMALRNPQALGVSDPSACVKVDDTVVGIEEGLRAGMWTVGVVMTGNELGVPEDELLAMNAVERAQKQAQGYAHLLAAGAHFVVDSIAELPGVLRDIRALVQVSRAA